MTWARARSCRWSRRSPRRVAVGTAPLPVSLRPHRRADRRDRARPACPTSTSRCSTCRSRCCGACAGGATASGSSAHRRHPGPSPDAAFRSNFIVGYPGETEADHDQLLAFVEEAQLDWCGFFSFSREDGTYAADLDGAVDTGLVAERLAELRELQDDITARQARRLIGSTVEVLVDAPGVGREPPGGARDRRHHRRAASRSPVGAFATVTIVRRDRARPRRRPSGLIVATSRSGPRRWPRRPTSSPSDGCSSRRSSS